MGVISDAIDALEDWCCDLFKDGIKSQFDGISDLLTDEYRRTHRKTRNRIGNDRHQLRTRRNCNSRLSEANRSGLGTH